MSLARRLMPALLSLLLLGVFLGAWHLATLPKVGTQVVDAEYAKLVGQQASTGQKSAFPTPADFGAKLVEHLRNPAYDRGASGSTSRVPWKSRPSGRRLR